MNQRQSSNQRWTTREIADQHGRTIVITGANTGIGFDVAKALAQRGAMIVLACRDVDKADTAAARIGTETVEVLRLDLGSLASVRQAAEQFRSAHPRLDLLINNAGAMMTPYGLTEDGFETQFGVSHLGHFAFTGLLLDRLLVTPESRVVTVSSPAHRQGTINFDDLRSGRRYRRMAAYQQSKLANLLFVYELQRRLAEAGAQAIALAAHPGAARTELNRHMPTLTLARGSSWGIWRLITQSAQMGALPILRAAVDPDASGGDYYGLRGRFKYKGHPIRRDSSALSHNTEVQRRLWLESERLTGITYRLAAPESHHTT